MKKIIMIIIGSILTFILFLYYLCKNDPVHKWAIVSVSCAIIYFILRKFDLDKIGDVFFALEWSAIIMQQMCFWFPGFMRSKKSRQ